MGSECSQLFLDDIQATSSTNSLHTPQVEVNHVHRVYDTIADHWNHTRYKAWPRVEGFIRNLARGSLVADLGCGNGKNIPTVTEIGGYVLASDMSEPLVRIAQETFDANVMVADCLRTNLRSGVFDAAISIAVLHHISTEPRRIQALREAVRVLRAGGELLVYCWSYEQDDERSKSHHRFPGQDVLVPFQYRTPGVKKASKVEASSLTMQAKKQKQSFHKICRHPSMGQIQHGRKVQKSGKDTATCIARENWWNSFIKCPTSN